MTFKHTLTISLLSLFVSGIALAAGTPPANVKNVQASIVSGVLVATWEAPADASMIASYRVYYSHQSILGSDGNYDDFEQTTGPANSYTFTKLPLTSPVIFIGVLAVNKEGVESEGFEVEASVVVPAGSVQSTSSSQESAPASLPSTQTPSSSSVASLAPLIVIGAEASSETGIVLTFNKPLTFASVSIPGNVQVADTGGLALPILSLQQTDAVHILLVTAAQRSDTTYVVSIMGPVTAQDGSVVPQGTNIAFRSRATAVTVAPTSATTQPPSEPSVPPTYGRNPALHLPIPMEQLPSAHGEALPRRDRSPHGRALQLPPSLPGTPPEVRRS